MIMQALKSVKENKIFANKRYPNSVKVSAIAAELESNGFQTDSAFVTDLGKTLWDVVSAGGKKFGSATEEKVCCSLHALKLNNALWDHWVTFVSANTSSACTSEQPMRLLFLHVIRSVMTALVTERNEQDLIGAPGIPQPVIELGEHDEQVLLYAAGYIPYALLKKFQRQSSNRAKGCAAFLLSWKIPHDSLEGEAGTFLQYTTKWVEKIDRGGLFRFNDEVYKFLRSMEIQTLKCLNKNVLLAPNINNILMTQLNDNPYVQRCWDSLVANRLPQEFSSYLLRAIKVRWIKLRVTAFVKVYLIMAKLKNAKVSRKGEKAMRKTVDRH